MRFTAKEPISYGTSLQDARRYEPGEELELDATSAEALLALDAIDPIVVEESPRKGKAK